MKNLGMTAKIWLSIGVFVLGYVLATFLGQVQGLNTESKLRLTAEALFPAAQKSQEAEAAFQRMLKGFSDAVMTQDAGALDRAVEEGKKTSESFKSIAAISGLPAERAGEARKLAGNVDALSSEGRQTYGTALANPAAMTEATQAQMRDLAQRTEATTAALKQAKERFSKDLQDELATVAKSSATQRWISLGVFFATLLVAAVIVSVTIRSQIARPILTAIDGMQEAANQATEASARMAEAGETVARNAQDQAAAVEETSASLEQISASTKENADRASKADQLMRDARQTMDHAAKAMDNLKISMDEISKSSKQVAVVLKSIDEIAFHTNILALNAAVEAARAGEAGAGFSVVADEVRSLAHRAAEAAKNSGEIIERTIKDVVTGVDLVQSAYTAFGEVSTRISGGSETVSQIAASSDEQARGIGQISTAISRIESVTQSNVQHARTTADNAAALGQQMQTTQGHLDDLVAVVGLHK